MKCKAELLVSLALRTRSFIIRVYIACNLSSDISGQTFTLHAHFRLFSTHSKRCLVSKISSSGWERRGSEGQARGDEHEPPLQWCGDPCLDCSKLWQPCCQGTLSIQQISPYSISTMRRRRARLLHIMYMYRSCPYFCVFRPFT